MKQSPEDEKLLAEISKQLGRKPHTRKVCGTPHRSREKAERVMRAARMGWMELEIETKYGRFVVTGIAPWKDPLNKDGVSPPITGRYRWPGPNDK